MLLAPIAFFCSNCSIYQLDKYNPNVRHKTRETPSKTNTLRGDIAQHAKKYIGTKYQYAGISPQGFDCSGFTCYVLQKYDVSIPRSSAAQANRVEKYRWNESKPAI